MDLSFPPTVRALCNSDEVIWRRPQEFLAHGTVRVFDSKPPGGRVNIVVGLPQ